MGLFYLQDNTENDLNYIALLITVKYMRKKPLKYFLFS